jgi:FkbM family methyltransferase
MLGNTKGGKQMNEMILRLRSIIGTDCSVIFEVGSCEGEDSMCFLHTFPNVHLFCFEPDPKNCRDHRRLITHSNCQLIEAAVTDKDGDTTFHRSGGRPRRASGSLRQPKAHLTRHPWCTFDEDITVPGIKLDTWCRQNQIDAIDLIWADVNGAETSMITGAAKTIQRTKYLYTEFGPDNIEVYEGSITKKQLIALLPQFEEVLTNNNNILLKNREIE